MLLITLKSNLIIPHYCQSHVEKLPSITLYLLFLLLPLLLFLLLLNLLIIIIIVYSNTVTMSIFYVSFFSYSPPPFTPPPPSPPPPSPCPTSPPPLPSPSRHTDKMPYQSHLQWHKNPHNTYFENFQNILKTNRPTNQPTDNTIYISDSPSLKNHADTDY